VERILDIDRNPRLAEHVEHEYRDKYGLADLLTNTSIISVVNTLGRLGLTAEMLKSIDTSKTTTLRFQASGSHQFLGEQVVEVQTSDTYVTKKKVRSARTLFAKKEKTTIHKVVKKVTEHSWRVTSSWEISLYAGASATDGRITLQSRKSSTIIVTQDKNAQFPTSMDHPPIELSLNWLLRMLDVNLLAAQFRIDRGDAEGTRTPRRNTQIDDALQFFDELSCWSRSVCRHFEQKVKGTVHMHNPAKEQPRGGSTVSPINASSIFCPILPLMETLPGPRPLPLDGADNAGAGGDGDGDGGMNNDVEHSIVSFDRPSTSASVDDDDNHDDTASLLSPLLPIADMHLLVSAHVQSIEEAMSKISSQVPAKTLDQLLSTSEASLVVLSSHMIELHQQYTNSIGYIEEMLKKQLIAAVGKEVGSHDLDQFMSYHNSRLLTLPPRSFCYAIQRPHHSPEGILSIEAADSDGKMESIETLCRQVEMETPLKIPLNAATAVEVGGKAHLHGWVKHRFDRAHSTYQLIARARQFSSFILIVGTMAGPATLNPKDAIIVHNKDELFIPLLLEEIPTAKDFKDAIKSLSPEQQSFANSFRSMQLDSSVFGVCIVEIKPQLESLLGLPADALAKEMKMTQDLMELFIEYQVPSDMLCFDGVATTSVHAKVEDVKDHIKAVMQVISDEKQKLLEDAKREASMEEAMSGVIHPDDSLLIPPMFACEEDYMEMEDLEMEECITEELQNIAMESRTCSAEISRCMDDVMEISRDIDKGPQVDSHLSVSPDFAKEYADDGIIGDQQQQQQQEGQERQDTKPTDEMAGINANASSPPSALSSTQVDFTRIPKMLDESIEKFDSDNALRSTTIKASNCWTRKRQANLLSKPESSELGPPEIQSEKNKAFDLLDALSRSGSLRIDCASLHVVVCVTHCFENDVMGTVIQDDINPIAKMERSMLLVGSAIHGIPARDLVNTAGGRGGDLVRLQESFPQLLCD